MQKEALEITDSLSDDIRTFALRLWEYAETALKEHKSAKLLADALEKEGFRLQRGVAGMPTAFIASYGSGEPIIGILAEYDALPSVGNEAVPRQEKRKDGVTNGHGCGHNVFGAASTGGAIALKRLMETHEIKGTIRLYGCPAEETLIGKVFMARDGLFDDLDAAIDWHPSSKTCVRNNPGLSMNNFTVEFFGKTAHGAVNPWDGRSALDAVEWMNYGVNLLREHVKPTARIHYVITEGGEAPNVVPDYAKVWYFVRDINRDLVEQNYQRVLKIAEGAAIGTETTHKVTFITGAHEYLLNRTMQERLQQIMEIVGPPKFTDEEQEFGRQMQESLGIETTGFATEIEPLAEKPQEPSGGSTDVAEVSWITPTIGFRAATTAEDVPWHSWAVTACNGTEAGVKGGIVAAKNICLFGLELLTDPELLEEAQEEFKKQTEGKPYESPLPKDQPVPLPTSKEME